MVTENKYSVLNRLIPNRDERKGKISRHEYPPMDNLQRKSVRVLLEIYQVPVSLRTECPPVWKSRAFPPEYLSFVTIHFK